MSSVGTLEQSYRLGLTEARTRYAQWLRDLKVTAPDQAAADELRYKLADAIARDELAPALSVGGT